MFKRQPAPVMQGQLAGHTTGVWPARRKPMKGRKGPKRDRPASAAECAEERRTDLDVPGLQVHPPGSLAQSGSGVCQFLPAGEGKKAGRKIRVGFSRFKSKKHGLGGFRLTGAIHIFDKAIQLPRLGRLRLKERGYLPVEGVHILSATVSEHAGHWFVSVQVEKEIPDRKPAISR